MGSAGGTTVLVVDDDEDMRALVKIHLELAGDIQVVSEAIDGPEALAAVERLQSPPVPTVIVLDNRMPGMTGLDVAAKVLERVPGQRIVLFSAYIDDATAAEAERLGITETVFKSRIADLAAIVRRHAKGV